MNTAEELNQFGDVSVLEAMQSEAANDSGEFVDDSYDELNSREKNGGGSWPFDPVIAENIALFSGIGFGVLANKRGKHWALTDDDSRRVGVAVAQVIHKYMPDFDNLGPVGNLAVVGATLIGPRMVLDAVTKSQATKQIKQTEAANDAE